MRRLVRASLNSSIRSPRDLAKQSAGSPEPAPSAASPSTSEHTTAWVTQNAGNPLESPIHWLVLVPYRFHGHGFNFDPIVREFREEETRVIIRRFMKRGMAPNDDVHAPEILIASRVVSRSHAEIWCESGGGFYIRDVSSSSGTYLNRERLAEQGQHSPAFPLRDGDVIQLGVDYEDGVQVMDRAVKIRVVIGHGKRRMGPSRLDVVGEGPSLECKQSTDILDPVGASPVDPTPPSTSSEAHAERSQHHLSGVSLVTHTGRVDNGMPPKAGPSLATPLAIEYAFSSSRPLSRSSLPYLAMSLDPETAPPRYCTPSPNPPERPVEIANSPSSKSSPTDLEPPSCTDSETPNLPSVTEIARYASENRNMISPDLEAKLIKAHYLPDDDPDEISSQEWQREYGVGYFELKRLRQLYARYSVQGNAGV